MNRKNNISKLLALVMVLSGGIIRKTAFGLPNPASVFTEKAFVLRGAGEKGMKWWFDSNMNGARARTKEQAIEFAKKYGCDEQEILEIWRKYHHNNPIDEKQIVQKCLKLNKEISQVTENFLNCYNSLHKIKIFCFLVGFA